MLLNLDQLAAAIGTDKPTVLAMLERGALPPPQILDDRLVRWPEERLADWAATGCLRSKPMERGEFVHLRMLTILEETAGDADLTPPDDDDLIDLAGDDWPEPPPPGTRPGD